MNKYIYMRLTFFATILIWLIWILTSCLQTDMEEIKSIPIQKKESSTIYHRDLGYHFHYQRGFNSVPLEVSKNVRMVLLDSSYNTIDYFFWLEFNNWYKKLKFENGIMAMNQKENLDCDNFAMFYKSLLGISFYKSESNKEPGVGLVVVEQVKPFGGVPAGGLHMLNIVFTSKDWYIFEPQTGQHIPLNKYPNQKHIQYIIL